MIDRITTAARYVSYHSHHFVEGVFLFCYATLQLALILATALLPAHVLSLAVSIFVLCLLTTFALNKIFLDMRYDELEKKTRTLEYEVAVLHGTASHLYNIAKTFEKNLNIKRR